MPSEVIFDHGFNIHKCHLVGVNFREKLEVVFRIKVLIFAAVASHSRMYMYIHVIDTLLWVKNCVTLKLTMKITKMGTCGNNPP